MVATWKIVAAALLIFAAGVVTGGVTAGAAVRTSRWSVSGTTKSSPADPKPSVPRAGGLKPSGPANVVQRIEVFRRAGNQLDLDAAQRAHIDQLLAESSERVRALWSPVAPKFQQEFRELRRQIAAELSPGQRERFEALIDRRSTSNSPAISTNGISGALR